MTNYCSYPIEQQPSKEETSEVETGGMGLEEPRGKTGEMVLKLSFRKFGHEIQ